MPDADERFRTSVESGVLGEIARAVNHGPTASESAQRTAEALGRYFGHPLGIWLKIRGTESVGLEGLFLPERHPGSIADSIEERFGTVPVSSDLPGPEAMRTGEKVVVERDDPELTAEGRKALDAVGATGYIALPILTGEGPAGFAVVARAESGRPLGEAEEDLLQSALGLVAIIFERVSLQERDRERAAEMHTLARTIDHLPHAVKISSPDWKIQRVNPAVEEILGYPPDELIGRSMESIRWEEGAEEIQSEIDEAIRSGAWIGEVLDRHRDGHPVPVRATVVPVRDEGGELVAIVDIEQDLTQEKTREARMGAAYRLASIGELAAGVAHEVNNPLHAISGTAELLLMEALPEDVRSDLQSIRMEAKRAGSIIRNLLAFARPRPPEKKPLDLDEVVGSVVELRLPQLRLASVTVEMEVDPATPPALADADQVRQIVHNLLANADHAIRQEHPEGRIVVRIRPRDGMVEMVVEDTGPGIREEVRKRIFDPFFTTKSVGEGTGLGLSVSYRLAEEHGGEITAGNWGRPAVEGGAAGEGGARIALRLPVAERAETREEVEASHERRPGVLVVDDDATVASVVRRFLSRSGFEAAEVHGGEEALVRLARAAPPGAILIDLRMPGMDGEELYRNIEERHPELADRVIFMSGDVVTPRSHDFLAETERPVLSKPYELSELEEVVRGIVEG